MSFARRFLFCSLLLLTACGPDEVQPPATPLPPEVTYTEHIRPLLASRCVGCHYAGGSTPFALEEYGQARMWAAAMASAVKDRRMPPYLADASGECQTFRDAPWLNEAEIQQFEQWALQGSPEGDTSIPPPAPKSQAKLSGDIVRIDIGADYLPDQSKTDDYRCFVIESPGNMGVSGFNVIPGNPRIVHHLIGYRASDLEAAQEARRLDAQSPEPGYNCLGTGPQVDTDSLAGWAPGGGAEIFPAGTGVDLQEDLPLILEIHYNIAGGPGETDRTILELQTVPAGTRTPLFELVAIDFDFEAPPGQSNFVTTDDLPVSWQLEGPTTGTLKLLSANGHMHKRGVSQRLERVKPNGDVECLLDIPRWNFDWQLTYWYDVPLRIDPEDTLRITCTFDTMSAQGPVQWGDGTDDEMCLGSFFAIIEEP